MSDPQQPPSSAPEPVWPDGVPPMPPMPPAPAGPPAPGYAQPFVPGHGAPPAPGYPQPAYGAPAAPYAAPVHPAYGAMLDAAPAPARRGSALGVVALVAALVAAVVAPVLGALFSFSSGIELGKQIAMDPRFAPQDLSFLTPVRDEVLLAELAFWGGTLLGVWAIVQGIVAVVTRRGRGAGIAAIVIAAVAAVVYGIAVFASVAAGIGAGSSIGG